jgi:hypothetical protein
MDLYMDDCKIVKEEKIQYLTIWLDETLGRSVGHRWCLLLYVSIGVFLWFVRLGYLKLAAEHVQKCQDFWKEIYQGKYNKSTSLTTIENKKINGNNGVDESLGWRWCSSLPELMTITRICEALGKKLSLPRISIELFQQTLDYIHGMF